MTAENKLSDAASGAARLIGAAQPLRSISPSRDTGAQGPIDVEALVARYAPIGRRRRRVLQLKRGAIVLASCVALLIAAFVYRSGVRTHATETGAAPAAGTSAPATQPERQAGAMSSEDRQRFEQEKALFTRQSAEFVQAIAQISAERQALDEQRQKFEGQQQLLADAIAKIDAQRRAMDEQQAAATRGHRPVETEMAQFNKQRQQLEEQQRRFEAQADQLAKKAGEVSTQRLELERQRTAIEQQRKQIEDLLERFNKVSQNRDEQRARGAAAAAAAQHTLTGTAAPATEALAMNGPAGRLSGGQREVGSEVLGGMRGGLQVGPNYEIALGVTRTVSVNGVEELASTLHFDGLSRNMMNHADLAQMQGVLVQNGIGNIANASLPSTATIIQNTLDNQSIATRTVLDISLQNVSSVVRGISASQAVGQSLSQQH